MHGESKQGSAVGIDAEAEHLVVLLVAGAPGGRRRASIHRELDDLGRERVEDAIVSLAEAGVVIAGDRSVRQSPALERIDWLHFIGV